MADVGPSVVAENGTVVEAGGVYLTYSGDPGRPYTFAKVIRIGASFPGVSPLLWARLYRRQWAEPPAGPSGRSAVAQINVAVFLAWGPPRFPVRVGTAAVTAADLATVPPEPAA